MAGNLHARQIRGVFQDGRIIPLFRQAA